MASRRRGMRRTYDEGDEYQRDAHSDEDQADCWRGPVHVRIVPSPSEPESADHHRGPGNHTAVQTVLGRRKPAPLFDKGGVHPRCPDADEAAQDDTDAHAEEDETALRDGEAAHLGEDDGDRLEHC